MDLNWLLDPITDSEFFRTNWEVQPLFIDRGAPDYFATLPGLDSVEELITATSSGKIRSREDANLVRSEPIGTPSAREIQLNVKGIPDIQDVYRAYREGYTVIVNRIHYRSAVVADLSRALEASLHHPVGVNLYLTPQHGQGLPPHVDTHDVFILQLHGVKEWHVGSPPQELPLANAEKEKIELCEFRKFRLNPGDMLYLPRGFPHEALTSTSSSLHLTVGVHAYRWIDLMSEALGALAEEDLQLRRTLPPGFLDRPLDVAHVSGLVEGLAGCLKRGPLAERAKVRLGTKLFQDAKAVGSGNFRSLDAIASLTEDSLIARVPDLFCQVRSNSGESVIEFPGNFVSGPLFLESALRFIANHDHFVVRDLPDTLSREDKLDLVGRLVAEGLLQILPESKEDV
ncbi:cupin domain-containing protein [Streptomyces sp. NPDC051776]|uniref:cupin domain-containing protein n=1 Tax=Streptomyces sp. NPDC051776 TaxID=3155414 RepID=UPI0034212977